MLIFGWPRENFNGVKVKTALGYGSSLKNILPECELIIAFGLWWIWRHACNKIFYIVDNWSFARTAALVRNSSPELHGLVRELTLLQYDFSSRWQPPPPNYYKGPVLAWESNYNFNVYVIRLWEVPMKYNAKEVWYLELILQDSKGERLHAVVPRLLIKKWGNVLKEFHMFNIKFLIGLDNLVKSRTTESDLVLTFPNRSQVTSIVNRTFLLEALRLKPINNLLQAERIDKAKLFLDIVALVVSKQDLREMLTKYGKISQRLIIVLEDLE
ncbi:hypothetical protein PIB30_080887 [Stylosanthes scabra]|uniref:Replication protein A 70 kDa DNA-binding subunit B/D first OB fold domain-containing protein n=1 Tax=Stylosanthes scabra TaxID=79078 RepID=A0ABU6QS87_9FABA|nr:hypothetical protein [Stylosanthes scabra]